MIGQIAGMAAGAIAGADQYIFHLVNGVYIAPALDRVMPALSWAGNLGAIWLALLGAIAVFGRRTGRRIALVGLGALVLGFFASEIIKEITLRPRPFLSLDEVRLLVAAPSSYAFPSGHTTNSFATATGLALGARHLLGRVPLWGWGSLVLAAAISYSRIYVGVHWPTDVLAGVALGVACGWIASRPSVGRFFGRLSGRRRGLRRGRRRAGHEILEDGAVEEEERAPKPLEVKNR